MQKLIILLKGISRLQTPPTIDGFTRIAGYDDLVWGGKLIEIEDFNSVADQVFGKARIPDGCHIAVRVIDEIEAEEPTEYLGEDLLPDLDLKEGETAQDVLKAVCDEVYNGSIVDWNNLEDLHKRNLINKAFTLPPKQESTVSQSNEAVSYKHRGNGKYDVYDSEGNVVLDNVTEDEAEEVAPGGRVPEPDPAPEKDTNVIEITDEVLDQVEGDYISSDEEPEDEEKSNGESSEEPSVDIDEASKDLESNLHWKKFEAKHGLKPKEFKEKHNL